MGRSTCYNCYEKVERKLGSAFARYGRLVARHPWKFILVTILVNGLLSIGMIRLQVENDVTTVYTPINSEASKDSKRVKALFPDLSGSNFVGLQQMPDLGRQAEIIIRAISGNVLVPSILGEVEKIYKYVRDTTINKNGVSINYTDICARNRFGCADEGDFFFSPEFILAVRTDNITFPYFYHRTFGLIYYETLVGGFTSNETHLMSAQMLRLRFNIRTDRSNSDSVVSWENEFLSRIKSFPSSTIEIAYMHSKSMEQELDKNISGDIILFTITFTLMITYSCFATFTARCDAVGQRANLGYPGVIAAGISIASSFGIVSACGVSYVSIVGVVPFLIIAFLQFFQSNIPQGYTDVVSCTFKCVLQLKESADKYVILKKASKLDIPYVPYENDNRDTGIGVDDMFILLSGLAGAQDKESVEEKIEETMRTSGVAITITSVTDLLAFAAGASSVFLSVRNFCIYTGVAVIFCYLNQATLFVACLTLHEKRVESNRHCMTCLPVVPKNEAMGQKKSGLYIICCTGSPPKSRTEAESFLDKFPGWLIPKIVLKLPLKIFILLMFAGYLAVSIYGVTTIKEGLELKNLVSENSYFYKYRQWLDDNFRELTPVSFVIPDTVVYSSSATQDAVGTLLKNAKSNPSVNDNFQISWLSAYKESPFYNDSSEDNFVTNLESRFLTYPLYQRFNNDVVIDTVNKRITASRFYIMSENLKSTTEQGQLMLDMRDVAKSSSLSPFAFSSAFIFYEQYVAVLPQTLQTVGIAVGIVFFVTVLFMPHPLLLIYVTITVVMIMVGILGFLPFLGLTLSTITMIHIIMSVGFSVDYAAHICHGFMIADGSTRDERVKEAVIRSGAPIFHGAASSFLGVITLAAAASYIFRSFFRVMILVIVFGLAHAVFFLPVILSFIGPHKAKKENNQTENMQSIKNSLEMQAGSKVALT